MLEVGIGIRPASFPPIIWVALIDHWVFIVMVKTEVEIGLRPADFLHIIIVRYTFTTQGFPRSYSKGVQGENLHQNHLYYSFTSIPPHAHHNMTPYPYPSMPQHSYFFAIIFHFYPPVCTLCIPTPPLYTILRLSTYTNQYTTLLHSAKPTSS